MRFLILFFYGFWVVACATNPLTSETGGVPARSPASYESIEPSTLLNRLRPFTSDGCPHLAEAISYPQEDQWRLCCVEHDKAYWKGGSQDQRQKADLDLQSCITERGSPEAARLVYYAVRSSQKWTPTLPWGYGWVLPRNTAIHSNEELLEIKKMEPLVPVDLRRVPTSVRNEKPSKTESLTGNRCIDASLTVLQRDLNKTVTPLQVHYETKSLVIGHEHTVKILSRECSLPYLFRYHLKSKNDCEAKRAKGHPIQLDSFEIPYQCE